MVSLHSSASSCVPLGLCVPNFGEEGKRMKSGLACVNVALDSFRHIRLQGKEGTAETFLVVSDSVWK